MPGPSPRRRGFGPAGGTSPGMTTECEANGWGSLPRRAGILEDRAEQLPAFAVEAHHLQLLVDAIVRWRGVDLHPGQSEVADDVLQRGCLLHDVLAREVVTGLLQHLNQELRGRVAVGVEARVLVALRIVLGHEVEIFLQ